MLRLRAPGLNIPLAASEARGATNKPS